MINRANISTITGFVESQSNSQKNRYVFTYTITIENISNMAFQLMSRHWIIQDADLHTEEVYGDGVIGEQPLIKPGDSYTYTSGAVLKTEMGTMQGKYFMVCANTEDKFEVAIPMFVLSVPRTIH